MKHAKDINFLDPDVQKDWYPAYEILRDEAPVCFMPELNMYVLTSYEDIKSVLRQPELFGVGAEVTSDALFTFPEARDLYEKKGWKRYQVLSENNPKHKPYRDIIDPFLSPRGVAKLEPFIRQTVGELIDKVIDKGEMDFIADFSDPLPMTVITEMLGLPRTDHAQIKQWSNAWVAPYFRGLTREQEIAAAEGHIEMQHYVYAAIQEKRKSPKDDLISHAVHAEFDDIVAGVKRPLTDVELIGMLDNLLVGGNETTSFAMSNGMWILCSNPELYAMLKADRSKINRFAEEALRFESPVQGLQRLAFADVEIRGVKIPKGATLHLRYAAANRDPAQFACPHQFDIERKNVTSHMAFSQGEHHCAGSALSKIEQRCAWDVLLDRMNNWRFSPGKNTFERLPGIVMRAFKELHIDFDKAS